MKIDILATGATVHTPSDSTVISEYPLGFWVGGTDSSQSATVVLAWKTAGGGSDKTCVFSVPVGSAMQVAGFYKILSTGTTLAATGGQVGYFTGALQR